MLLTNLPYCVSVYENIIVVYLFIVRLEANESIMNITTKDLGGMVTSDQLSIGNPNTLHTVGDCVTAIRYANCLLEPESFIWYLNGSEINNTNFTYALDENGRLTFTNAQENHAGLYLCIITLPGQFGSYITTATELTVSVTETPGKTCM